MNGGDDVTLELSPSQNHWLLNPNGDKIKPKSLPEVSWRLLGLSDCIFEACRWLLVALERLFEPPESAKNDFEAFLRPQEEGAAT